MGDSGVTPASGSSVWDALKVFQGYIQVLTDLKTSSEALKSEKDELQKQLDAEKGANEQLNKTNTELKTANEELDKAKNKLQNDYDELVNTNKSLQEKCDSLETENKSLHEQLDHHTCHDNDTEYQDLKKQKEYFEALSNTLQGDKDSLKKDKDNLQQTVDKLNDDITKINAAKDTIERERDQLSKANADLTKERDDYKDRLQKYGDIPIPVDIIYNAANGGRATEPMLSNEKKTLGNIFHRTSGPFEVYSLSREAKVGNVRFTITPTNNDPPFDLTVENPIRQIGSNGKGVDVFDWVVEGIITKIDPAGVAKSDQTTSQTPSS